MDGDEPTEAQQLLCDLRAAIRATAGPIPDYRVVSLLMWIALPCHFTDGITAHFEGLLPRRSMVLPHLEVVHQWFLQHQIFNTEGLVDLLDMGGAAWTVGQPMTERGLRDALGDENLGTLQRCGEELGRVYDDINSEDLCPICLQCLWGRHRPMARAV